MEDRDVKIREASAHLYNPEAIKRAIFKAGAEEVVGWLLIQLGSRDGKGSLVTATTQENDRVVIPEILWDKLQAKLKEWGIE